MKEGSKEKMKQKGDMSDIEEDRKWKKKKLKRKKERKNDIRFDEL